MGHKSGEDLEAFQATVNRLHRYRDEGLMEIVSEKRDSRSRERYVARVRIRLTPSGVEWRKKVGKK